MNPKSRDTQSKAWVFTWNNYTEEELNLVHHVATMRSQNSEKFKYAYGLEIAPTTGTPHIQGFFDFGSATRFSTIQKLLTSSTSKVSFLEGAKGNYLKNKAYCTKAGESWTNIKKEKNKEELALEAWNTFKKENHWDVIDYERYIGQKAMEWHRENDDFWKMIEEDIKRNGDRDD